MRGLSSRLVMAAATRARRRAPDRTGSRGRKPLFSSNTGEIHRQVPKLGHIAGCPANEGLVRSLLSIRCPPKDGQTDTQFMYPT